MSFIPLAFTASGREEIADGVLRSFWVLSAPLPGSLTNALELSTLCFKPSESWKGFFLVQATFLFENLKSLC